jgi:hypothetical protein
VKGGEGGQGENEDDEEEEGYSVNERGNLLNQSR